MKSLFLCLSLGLFNLKALAHPPQYSRVLKPRQSAEYYLEQADRYFDSLDTYSRSPKPRYSKKVIRWEWYPWLYLTGYKDHWMWLDKLVTIYPTKVINRNCVFRDIQPFVRCRVTFHYLKSGSLVDIYEEFTFNDYGEMTFVEAWSDVEGLMPMDPDLDYWGEGANVSRLSTKVPGLGERDGLINRRQLRRLSKNDGDLKNLRKRLIFTIYFWSKESIRLLINGHGH